MDHMLWAQQAILPAAWMLRLQSLPSQGNVVPFPISQVSFQSWGNKNQKIKRIKDQQGATNQGGRNIHHRLVTVLCSPGAVPSAAQISLPAAEGSSPSWQPLTLLLSHAINITQLKAVVEKSYRARSGETGLTGSTLPIPSHHGPSCETGSGEEPGSRSRQVPHWGSLSAGLARWSSPGHLLLPRTALHHLSTTPSLGKSTTGAAPRGKVLHGAEIGEGCFPQIRLPDYPCFG